MTKNLNFAVGRYSVAGVSLPCTASSCKWRKSCRLNMNNISIFIYKRILMKYMHTFSNMNRWCAFYRFGPAYNIFSRHDRKSFCVLKKLGTKSLTECNLNVGEDLFNYLIFPICILAKMLSIISN